MISMSFGFSTSYMLEYDELEAALKEAAHYDVLLFAAASNSGGREGRAFLACEESVICVYCTDTYGNPSDFSSTAVTNGYNLATVGEGVASAWPATLCDGEEVTEVDGYTSVTKLGTSFATPIMVGIAAMLVAYVRLHLPGLKRRVRKK